MKTKDKIADSAKAVEQAEEALRQAKLAHREAFRQACAALFNEFGLCIEANGSEGAYLKIQELDGYPYDVGQLPD